MTNSNPSPSKAWIITGPTSGIGYRTALQLARHGTVFLVGRDRGKLDEVKKEIQDKNGYAVSVICDLSDITSARRAALAIVDLDLPIGGLLSARGEWGPGGSKLPGGDAYATSKQGNLATVFAFARESPRLRFNAIEPGFSPGSNLGRDAKAALRFLSKYVMSPLAPLIKYWSTPKRAARVITAVLTDEKIVTGGYFDENGKPMLGSAQVRDPEFQDRVVAETRALLAGVQSTGR